MNKKDLLRICVYVVGFVVIPISNLFLYRMIPTQTYKFFSTMGMVRSVISLLIAFIVCGAIYITLRKYGAQITSTTPKTRIMSGTIIVALLVFLIVYLLVLFIIK